MKIVLVYDADREGWQFTNLRKGSSGVESAVYPTRIECEAAMITWAKREKRSRRREQEWDDACG